MKTSFIPAIFFGLLLAGYSQVSRGPFYGSLYTPSLPTTNLVAWYAADRITGLSNNDSVTTWSDLTVYANHTAQATASKKPTYLTNQLNGKPTVHFDGGDTLAAVDSNSLDLTAPAFIVGVFKTESTTAMKLVYKDGQYQFGTAAPAGTLIFTTLGVKDYFSVQRPAIASEWMIVAAEFDASCDASFYVNGAKFSTVAGTVDISLSNTALYIGSDGTANYLTGDIAELAIYNHAPSAADMYVAQRYLATKWGIASTLNLTIANAASALTTPTYDTSGQAMHPDVLYIPVGWNGYSYWMAMTPFPGGDATKENPSILASNDGTAWVVPAGLTNPIVADPGGGYHNADVDLLLGQDGKLYLFYCLGSATTWEILVRSSSDGVAWSAATSLVTGANNCCSSPAVVWDGAQYVMWYINEAAAPDTLLRRTASTPDGTWSAEVDAKVIRNASMGDSLHHGNVTKRGSKYFALFDVTSLNVCMASTGLLWVCADLPMMGPSVSGWDNAILYRGSVVWTNLEAELFYSGRTAANVWHTGRVRLPM
ncbi:MAG: LamG-like jellyroll fold domain-containing protein [Planctomycetota bacterium]